VKRNRGAASFSRRAEARERSMRRMIVPLLKDGSIDSEKKPNIRETKSPYGLQIMQLGYR
jgi:hypothetical protein